MRSFLWGRLDGGRRIPWVAWEQICKSSQVRGMGIGFLSWKNKALLLKWAWRFGREKDSFWRRAICAGYGWNEQILLLSSLVENINLCYPLLHDILKVLVEDTVISKVFNENCVCCIGQGNNVRFWQDPWVETTPLFTKFPRMFALATNKNAKVSEMGVFINGSWEWDLGLRRRLFDWEIAVYQEMLCGLNSVRCTL